jgi:S-methylmethionine-dependent homocysteine/selenocysteine methylase
MYGHGFALSHFAMFPLLDDASAVRRLTSMYQAVLDVAVQRGMGVLLGGLDYRASPDWAGLLGLDAVSLAAYQHRSIAFLRDVAEPYRARLPHVLICGIVGPQGDAYQRNMTVTQASAESYHATQIANLAAAGVDLVQAMTLTSTDEAIGVIRAARARELPIIVSFMADRSDAANGMVSLREAIERVDAETDGYATFFGVNCSHPLEFEPLFEEPGDWITRVGLLRPNASAREKVALCQIGHLERGDPSELASAMGRLSQRLPHVVVWGGCCGTWDEHLRLIADAIATNKS